MCTHASPHPKYPLGRSYLIAIRGEKKPTEREIIIDVPLATRILW
ncbi:hypothetical protein, partial [Salmonella sp. NW964]